MKPLLILAPLLALAACVKPPTEQAGLACQQAGHMPGSPGYAQCFQAVLPAYVQSDTNRRTAAAGLIMGNRVRANCTTIGTSTTCY